MRKPRRGAGGAKHKNDKWNLFRDLMPRALKMYAPPAVMALLTILDKRRKSLHPDAQWVLIGYGGQPRKSGEPPPRNGFAEEIDDRYGRNSFIRAVHWAEDHGLLRVVRGGGVRLKPIRQPNRAGRRQVAEYRCGVGGRGPDGKGRANAYAPAGTALTAPEKGEPRGGPVDADDQVGDVAQLEAGRALLREATGRLSRPRDGP
jgi:hypothetical protein